MQYFLISSITKFYRHFPRYTSLLVLDLYKKYLVLGLTFVLFSQTFINIGVVIGLLPVTGITLPFISVGGTSLLITIIQVSIILNISKEVDNI